MSVNGAPPLPRIGPAERPEANPELERKPDPKVRASAQQFEGLLLQQMLKVLWETAPGMSGPSAGMYQQLFQGPLADHLARAGGIGLQPMLERAMRPHDSAAAAPSTGVALPPDSPALAGIAAAHAPRPATAPVSGEGALQRIEGAVSSLLEGGGERWSRVGTLDAQDLMPDPTATGGSAAHTSIRDARGYQGYYKCNLFALETARRAGFDVPVVGNQGSFAYPLSNDITRDAADGRMRGDWARVVTGTPAGELDTRLREGTHALMLTGSGMGERRGHMAVVERVRAIEYDTEGQVRKVVFDGWEARPDGARHLTERTWNLHGEQGGHDARNGFQRIEILELRQVSSDTAKAGRSAPVARSGQTSDLGSSQPAARPIESSEVDR